MISRDFTFAHLADAHVGAWPRDAAVRNALRESVLKALQVVDERDCEFLLISGDLFHTPVPDPAEVAPVASALRKLVEHGRRVYVIYGSHDYVAHRTSWLDVLAETGLFLRAAPEAIRVEGDRWTLPFLVDPPTGARIAGISGRSHGLDRSYFLAVDSEAFRSEPGFKIFQFHAAIEEYLPEHLVGKIPGISREDLPGGCEYYAGGHIHYTYRGTGPGGRGLLVNPGAVFGTKVPDLENGALGRSRQGVVIVTVREGRPTAEHVDTAPTNVRVFDVDLTGETVEKARETLDREIRDRSTPGAMLFPRVHGILADGSIGTLGLQRSDRAGTDPDSAIVHWDVTDLAPARSGEGEFSGSAEALESEALAKLAEEAPPALRLAHSPEGTFVELLRALGVPLGEGESRSEYEEQRLSTARRLLGLPSADPV